MFIDLGLDEQEDPGAHEHQFAGDQPERHLVACEVPGCTNWRIVDHGALRELNAKERVSLTCLMMEDLILAQAMVLIHGRERGLERIRASR